MFTVYWGGAEGSSKELAIDTDTFAINTEDKTFQVYDEWTEIA